MKKRCPSKERRNLKRTMNAYDFISEQLIIFVMIEREKKYFHTICLKIETSCINRCKDKIVFTKIINERQNAKTAQNTIYEITSSIICLKNEYTSAPHPANLITHLLN